MTVRFSDHTIDWLGYATLRWASPAGTVVYTDPGRYEVLTGRWAASYGGRPHPRGDAYAAEDADVVLVTHDHHYDDDGVRRVADADATVVVHEAVDAARIVEEGGRTVVPPEELPYEVRRLDVGERLTVGEVEIEATPAYNRPDGPNVRDDGTPIHPQGMGCGFRVAMAGTSWWWTGDTDRLESHEDLDVDVFVPTIAHTITMDRHDAAGLARAMQPRLVVPIHYNTFDGLAADGRAFAADVASAGIPVALDERNRF